MQHYWHIVYVQRNDQKRFKPIRLERAVYETQANGKLKVRDCVDTCRHGRERRIMNATGEFFTHLLYTIEKYEINVIFCHCTVTYIHVDSHVMMHACDSFSTK
jgi:hypothetical protein